MQIPFLLFLIYSTVMPYEIFVTSRNRVNADYSLASDTTSFSVKLGTSIGKVKYARLDKLMLDYAVYNIDTNTRDIEIGTASQVANANNARLTQGYYSGPELAAHMTTIFNAAFAAQSMNGTWTVTYNTNTFKFTIAITGMTSSPANLNFINVDSLHNSGWRVTGFLDQSYSIATGTSITSTNAAELFPLHKKFIIIDIAELSDVLYTANAPSSANTRIKMNYTFLIDMHNGIAGTQFENQLIVRPTKIVELTELNIRLKWMDDTTVNLNNLDWGFIMSVWTEDEIPEGLLTPDFTFELNKDPRKRRAASIAASGDSGCSCKH